MWATKSLRCYMWWIRRKEGSYKICLWRPDKSDVRSSLVILWKQPSISIAVHRECSRILILCVVFCFQRPSSFIAVCRECAHILILCVVFCFGRPSSFIAMHSECTRIQILCVVFCCETPSSFIAAMWMHNNDKMTMKHSDDVSAHRITNDSAPVRQCWQQWD